MAKYAATPADITDAYTGNAAEMQIGGRQVYVEGTLGDVETALKGAATSNSLANLAELVQTWILGAADADYGFIYWKKLGPVRVTPSQAVLIRKLDATPVERPTGSTPQG